MSFLVQIRDFMKSLSRNNQPSIIEAFNSISRYLDNLLNIDNLHFEQTVDKIYPAELQLNKVMSSDIEAPFCCNLSISVGTISIKVYYKQDDFDFDIFNFSFLDDDVPRRISYLNLFVSLGRLFTLVTSVVVTKP